MFVSRSNIDNCRESGMNFNDEGKISAPGRLDISCLAVLKQLSHEMRTHMNAVVAFSFIMNKDGYTEKEREEFSDQVMKSCEQLIGLFDNFLDTSMIDTGSSPVDFKALRPDIFLNDLISDLRGILKREKKDDVVLVTENQYIRAGEVKLDTNKLSRLIRSVFNNALHNTRSGYIKIGYSLENDCLNFWILDSGRGFVSTREFFQTTDLNASLGIYSDVYQAINIILARNLIHLLEGKIWVESNGPGGSAVWFSIPVQAALKTDREINRLSNGMITI